MARRTTGGTPATVALAAAGVAHRLHPYRHDDATTSYGDEAVAALGLDPEQVLKTLLADLGGELVVAVVPVVSAGSRGLRWSSPRAALRWSVCATRSRRCIDQGSDLATGGGGSKLGSRP